MTSTKLTTPRWKEIAICYGRWFAVSFTLAALVVGANFFNHQYMDMSVWHWMQFKDMSETEVIASSWESFAIFGFIFGVPAGVIGTIPYTIWIGARALFPKGGASIWIGIQSVFRDGEKELWWERRSERRSN